MSKRPNVYIDGNNLHRSSKDLGFDIDYKKFYGWLRQKYSADRVYIFLGFVKYKENFYNELDKIGYQLIFKETIKYLNSIKGNCDTELVVTLLVDLYENKKSDFVVITNDGDFAFLIKLLILKNKKVKLCSPNLDKCSTLLRKVYRQPFDLSIQYYKFSKKYFIND